MDFFHSWECSLTGLRLILFLEKWILHHTEPLKPPEAKETVGKMSYHGVAQNEDGQVGVAGLHQVDVLQRVSDVILEILDVHPLPFTLTVADCGRVTEEDETRVRKPAQERIKKYISNTFPILM